MIKIFQNPRSLYLFLIGLYLIGFLFSVFIYPQFTSTGDGYDPTNFDWESTNYDRTQLVLMIYKILSYAFSHQLSGLFIASLIGLCGIIILSKIRSRKYRNLFIFSSCSLFYLSWSAIPSKEQVIILASMVAILSYQNLVVAEKFLVKLCYVLTYLAAAGLLSYLRYPFLILFIPLILVLISDFLDLKNIDQVTGIFIFLLFVFIVSLGFSILIPLPEILEVIRKWVVGVSTGFLSYDAGSNRYFFELNHGLEFLLVFPFGMMGIFLPVGYLDIFERPEFIAVFVANVIPLVSIVYCTAGLVHREKTTSINSAVMSFWVPCILCLMVVVAPYLAFNAGATLRYVQGFYPILVFFPLVLFDLTFNES